MVSIDNQWENSTPPRRHGRRHQRSPSALSNLLPSTVSMPPSSIETAAAPLPHETRRVVLKRKSSPPPASDSNKLVRRQQQPALPVSNLNRKDSCPILVRIFYSTNGHHTPLALFSNGKLPQPEIRVNTWSVLNL